jgi:hypothetical protein
MTTLVMLLMTTAVPSADPVVQPPPASWGSPGDEGPQAAGSPRRFSRLRGLFGRRSQAPQQQPGCACGVQPVPVEVSGAPSAAGPITPPVMSQGPPQQPGGAAGAPPGGAGRLVPVPVSGAPSAAGPITRPVMSQGPQQQPGGAAGAPPGGAGQLVPVPVSGTPSATEPSPAMSRPEVTTRPVPPEMRRMPVGPAGPS